MHRLSTGHDSTLANYRIIAEMLFGTTSEAVKYLDDKIAKDGANAEVLADESQMIHLLSTINAGKP